MSVQLLATAVCDILSVGCWIATDPIWGRCGSDVWLPSPPRLAKPFRGWGCIRTCVLVCQGFMAASV